MKKMTVSVKIKWVINNSKLPKFNKNKSLFILQTTHLLLVGCGSAAQQSHPRISNGRTTSVWWQETSSKPWNSLGRFSSSPLLLYWPKNHMAKPEFKKEEMYNPPTRRPNTRKHENACPTVTPHAATTMPAFYKKDESSTCYLFLRAENHPVSFFKKKKKD